MVRVNHPRISFSNQIDDWVVSAIRAGAHDLDSLVAELPGVYPVDVLQSVRRLVNSGVVPRSLETSILYTGRVAASPQASSYGTNRLPVPHPLDYDWRFTQQTVDDLLDIAQKHGEKLICLGTPSVFATATMRPSFQLSTLLDRNASLTSDLPHLSHDIYCCDILRDDLPQLEAEVVVADPPWYGEYYRAFLWAASEMCPMGARVLLSLPSEGTRPRIPEEAAEILDWAEQLGFTVSVVEENRLSYVTPHFERNALLAAGVNLSRPAWRKGTLCILKKQFVASMPRPIVNPSRRDSWEEARLYGTRFFFRKRSIVGCDDPSLIPLVNGSILASVSRTHRLRQFVDVWTSGNRVFRCQSPMLLQEIVQTIARRGHDRGADGFYRIRRGLNLLDQSVQAIHDLASMERDERRFIGTG